VATVGVVVDKIHVDGKHWCCHNGSWCSEAADPLVDDDVGDVAAVGAVYLIKLCRVCHEAGNADPVEACGGWAIPDECNVDGLVEALVYGWRLAFGTLRTGVDGVGSRVVSLGVPTEEVQSGPGEREVVVVPMVVHVSTLDCLSKEVIWYYHLWWGGAIDWCIAEKTVLIDDEVVVRLMEGLESADAEWVFVLLNV